MNDRVIVYDEQGHKLDLGPNDHIATGGEGAVYARKDQVFKIYLDPAKAQRARLAEKAAVLSKLQHPGVAAPTGTLLDKSGALLGLTFPRVDGEALCKLFTNAWRDANQFGPDETRDVVLKMRAIMAYAHSQQALLVDANELNWLVKGANPTVIDVDSWQLPGFPATAIMPSIRDPLAVNGFTQGSDWFAWAIVTFQLWTGIHPYKGTHPDFARGALEARMQAKASIFDNRVTVPAAVRSPDSIPPALKAWYRDVLQDGARTAPPTQFTSSPAAQTAPRLKVVQTLSASLKQERLGHAGGPVLAAFQGYAVVRASDGLRLWDALRKAEAAWVTPADCERVLQRRAAVLRLPHTEVVLTLAPGSSLSLRARDGSAVSAPIPTGATRLWQSGTRVFALVENVPNGLVELSVTKLGDRSVLTVGSQWPVSTLSSQFLQGCFVQDCLGTPFLGVLEGEGLVQMRAPALRGYRVVHGLGLDQHNIWLTAVRKSDGETVRLHMRAAADRFELAEETPVADTDLNGALLASGVGIVQLGADLRVSRGEHAKEIPGCGLAPSARLLSMGATLGVFDGSELSKLSLG